MKNFSYSAATMLVIAGSAFAQSKNAEHSILEAVPGFTGPGGDERSGMLIPYDVTGIQSGDPIGSPINQVFFLNIGAGCSINGIGWDVTLSAFGASWRSELGVYINNSANVPATGFTLRPGTDTSPGGPTNYRSEDLNGAFTIAKLANYNIPDVVALADGLIRLEFFESYDDVAGAFEGLWNSGFLFLQKVPTPASAGLLGLAGVGLLGRKRR